MKLIDKDALVAEITRHLNIFKYDTTSKHSFGRMMECNDLLVFIDTLEMKEDPVSEDLEEAALLHYPKMSRISEPHGVIPADNESHYIGDANEDNRKAFKVGAEWKREQMIEKAADWLEDHIYEYLKMNRTWNDPDYNPKLIGDFRNYMKEK